MSKIKDGEGYLVFVNLTNPVYYAENVELKGNWVILNNARKGIKLEIRQNLITLFKDYNFNFYYDNPKELRAYEEAKELMILKDHIIEISSCTEGWLKIYDLEFLNTTSYERIQAHTENFKSKIKDSLTNFREGLKLKIENRLKKEEFKKKNWFITEPQINLRLLKRLEEDLNNMYKVIPENYKKIVECLAKDFNITLY